MKFEIWVDSDSFPENLRKIVLNRCYKNKIPVHFVADRELRDITAFYGKHTGKLRELKKGQNPDLEDESLKEIKSWIQMHVVPVGSDSADDFIVENVKSGSLVITHDIPLAARLLEKDAVVIDDRGGEFDKGTIKRRLSSRDVNMQLREWSVFFKEKNKEMGQRETREFSNAFDRECTKMGC